MIEAASTTPVSVRSRVDSSARNVMVSGPPTTPTASEVMPTTAATEVRGSRSKGVSCRVTLRKGEESYIGEAHGIEGDRSRLDLAARATVFAIGSAEGRDGQLAVEGVKVMEAFDREYVFVGVTVRSGRDSQLLVGNCEIKGSGETASALAVLAATNRWVDQVE